MRIGMGYDVHKLVEERDLILGGVKIIRSFRCRCIITCNNGCFTWSICLRGYRQAFS